MPPRSTRYRAGMWKELTTGSSSGRSFRNSVENNYAAPLSGQKPPASVVIIGGGAAGLGAAEMLRREGYDGSVTVISADDWPPYDRPNLSKDFLAGAAPDEWMRLRVPDYYREQQIDLLLSARVSVLDIPAKTDPPGERRDVRI